MAKIKILLADDHEIVRSGLASMLNSYDDFEEICEHKHIRIRSKCLNFKEFEVICGHKHTRIRSKCSNLKEFEDIST